MPNPPSLGAEITLVNTLKESTLKKLCDFLRCCPGLLPTVPAGEKITVREIWHAGSWGLILRGMTVDESLTEFGRQKVSGLCPQKPTKSASEI